MSFALLQLTNRWGTWEVATIGFMDGKLYYTTLGVGRCDRWGGMRLCLVAVIPWPLTKTFHRDGWKMPPAPPFFPSPRLTRCGACLDIARKRSSDALAATLDAMEASTDVNKESSSDNFRRRSIAHRAFKTVSNNVTCREFGWKRRSERGGEALWD